VQQQYRICCRYYECLEIKTKLLPQNHPTIASTLMNTGTAYSHTNDQVLALSYMQKALEIKQKSLQHNHISLASLYNNIGLVYISMNELDLALENVEIANRIFGMSLLSEHPCILDTRDTIEQVKKELVKRASSTRSDKVTPKLL